MHTFKVTATILILLVIIIMSGIFSTKILESSAKRIENQVVQIESHAKSGNWEKAEIGLVAVKKDWKKASSLWAALIDHVEIDNIDESLIKMEKYIAVKDTSMALAEASTLGLFIKHIPDREAFNLKNIL